MPIEEMSAEDIINRFGVEPNDGRLSPAIGRLKECLFQLIGALRSKNASQAPVFDALTILLYGALTAKDENEISSFCASNIFGEFSPFVLNLSMLSKTDTACKSVLVEMQQVFSGRCYSMALVNEINTEKKRDMFFRKNRLNPPEPEVRKLEAELKAAQQEVNNVRAFCRRYMLKV